MNPNELGAEQWRTLLEKTEPATRAEVERAIEDALELSPQQAREKVGEAIDDGTLTETDTGGMFPVLTVAESTAESDGGDDEGASPTADPEPVESSSNDVTEATVADRWDDADFSAPEPGVWPPAWERREFWMARKGKKPFAPWADADHPDAAAADDARFKWSITDNWADKETVDEWVDKVPSIDGHAVLLEKENDPYTDDPDPFAFVDGDDVRCPETGEVHPAFLAILKQLGHTYADISTSGAGVHALYRGRLPEGVNSLTFPIDTEPWGENDERPGIEIYDGKRVCVVTGEHVPGSAADVEPWDDESLGAIVDVHADDEDRRAMSHDTDRELEELSDYEPTATGGDEITDDIRDVFAAIDRLGVHDLPLRTRQVGEDGTGWGKWDPSTYRHSSGKDSLHTPDRKAWYDQKTGRSFGLLRLFAAEQGIIRKPWHQLRGAEFWEAVERAREHGAPIPQLDTTADGAGGRYFEECEPPLTAEAEPLDVEARREAMQGELFDAFTERDGLTVWAHNPGEGKTTTAAIAAAQRDREHVVLLPKHENCREFQLDETKPDGYMHLKGAGQPRDDGCMDAEVADEECKRHIGDCPAMCPVYSSSDVDEDLRETFRHLSRTVGVQKAHEALHLHEKEWHDEKCEWQQQWDRIDSADRVVTVHNYATLKSVREHGDIIIDDLQGGLKDDTPYELSDLSQCRQALRTFAGDEPDDSRVGETLAALASFLEDAVSTLSDSTADEASLADIDVPEFPDDYTREFDSRADVPDDVPESDIDETSRKEYVGEGGQYEKETAVEATVHDLAETLAQAKHTYNQTLMARVHQGRWAETPFYFDAVLAMLAAAGADGRACRIAASVPTVIDTCPKCDSRLASENGRKYCTESGCGWDEENGQLTYADDTPARIVAQLDATDVGVRGITVTGYPAIDELPDASNVLGLNATPRAGELAALFDVDEADVAIDGNDAYALPHTTVTQITDGAYHRSTLTESETAQTRAQAAIDRVADMHDDVIYVVLKKAESYFEWPDDAEVLHYYALRGLDRPEADAIVCVGAPHPAEDDLYADARALTAGDTNARIGGRELSTRRGEDVGEPVYRKLNYTDAEGRGRAVASKAYTGLIGELFDARHANELEQAAHRHRPVLATEADSKHVYMLTNVATELPVDRLTSFDTFLNPTEAHIDVRDSALELLDTMTRVAREDAAGADYATDGGAFDVSGTVSEWYDAAQSGGMDVSKRTIRNALDDLTDEGLVDEGDYVKNRGRLKTLTALGARVASR
jgi:hypothetical protein